MEACDGTWQVGRAGEVEFAVRDRQLVLVDARPTEGWQWETSKHSPARLEVEVACEVTGRFPGS